MVFDTFGFLSLFQRARQLRLVGGTPPVFGLCCRVVLSPFIHGGAIEQVFNYPRIEDVKCDPARSSMQPDRSRSSARKAAILQPTLSLRSPNCQDILDLAGNDRKFHNSLEGL
jgi:hypothetical protein